MLKISFNPKISQQNLIIISAVLFCAFYNFSFFKNFIAQYGGGANLLYLGVSAVILTAFIALFFTLFSSCYTTKSLLIATFSVSSFTAYFMDNYNVVIDSEMVRNTLETNFGEACDLFSAKLLLYTVFLGILPCFLIIKTKIVYRPIKAEIQTKLKVGLTCAVIISVLILSFSKFYSSFFREHKSLRYYTNPTYWIYSIANFAVKSVKSAPKEFQKIGEDAWINKTSTDPKELVVLVVGESVRADRLALNGYKKPTDPLLSKQKNVISLSNVYSCGTSTAYSVPCMFSSLTREDFSVEKAARRQNVLDILKENTKNVEILWRDNNSDSKGVAIRTAYEDFKTPKSNGVCDDECRDIGMLKGLDEFIAKNGDKDILIILHQMGNHGPAYFKRYPKEFEKFIPVCRDSELQNCSVDEISNAYDNAVLYTDYFLSSVIDFLKTYSSTRETAMIYMGDHGESLGEKGIYLHGMPYIFAPEAQKRIASIVWLGGEIEKRYDINRLKNYKDRSFSHDNLFHTLLGIFKVRTKIYDKNLDILDKARIYK